MRSLRLLMVFAGLMSLPPAARSEPKAAADRWLTSSGQFPTGTELGAVTGTNVFETLHAEFLAGKLKLFLSGERFPKGSAIVLRASAQEIGHWLARDWRSFRMAWSVNRWETTVPVEDVDVPIVYFVKTGEGTDAQVSPMRLVFPRDAGMEEPTRIFWPFLEGFEEGTDSWQMIGPSPQPRLRADAPGRNGLTSLVVPLAANQRSVTVATTRVRGWQIQKEAATGVGLWVRTRTGNGQARFAMKANAFTTNQVTAAFKKVADVTAQWQKVELSFADLGSLPWRGVDVFTIELIGVGPREFLVDDLHLLGPWKLDVE